MSISVKCSECGKRLSGPDSAAGRKVKCPQCGHVAQFPVAGGGEEVTAKPEAAPAPPEKGRKSSTADLAQALSAKPAAVAPEEPSGPSAEEPSAESPSPPPLAAGSSLGSSRRSSTTMSRMLARSSPYKTLRLLGVIMFGTGIVVAVLLFLGGLTGLIVGSMAGLHPALTVGMFVAALVLAAVTLLVGKAAGELIRLWADVGDRARHLTVMFEETVAQQRTGDVNDGGSR